VALKFRGKQATVKGVYQALDKFYAMLKDRSVAQSLNEKLAEYAFFPLTHIFNESQRLSSQCLEVAVLSLQILAAQGWRAQLSPEMGKQLLILLTLLAGGSPGQNQPEPPSDDLKVAAFNCIGTVVILLGSSPKSRSIFHDVGTRTIVDHLVYLLLGAISDGVSEKEQLAASHALLQVYEQIEDRLVLASLLPRTVSTLTKVLRPSTQQRRTHKVLEANLNLLSTTLHRVLNDQVALESPETQTVTRSPEDAQINGPQVLDRSWLKATSAQIKIALTNVAQLRRNERVEVRKALSQLCMMVLEECSQSLAECASLMLETLLYLSTGADTKEMVSDLKYLLTLKPPLVDDLQESLQRWMSSLPRLMRASDDRPKQSAMSQISGGFQLLSSLGHTSKIIEQALPVTLIDSVVGAIQPQDQNLITSISEPASSISQLLTARARDTRPHFRAVLLSQKANQGALTELRAMIASFGGLENAPNITRTIIDTVAVADGTQQLSAIWLALKLLEKMSSDTISDFVDVVDTPSELTISKPFLVSDLYSFTLALLVDDEEESDSDSRWQLQALALECLVLQADQLGISYRPELMESLYPVLSLLGSQNGSLQQHAMTALDLLAQACQYSSVTDMLVENVDYLVNSIALKLNSSNLAPQAPQVLLMMVRLCGARLIPYLDDLVGSIFVALDDFHGYPILVETLFDVLSAIVDEGARRPNLAITEGKEAPEHRKNAQDPSNVEDILDDLTARKSRKRNFANEDENHDIPAPQRPWSDKLDGLPQETQEHDEDLPIGDTDDNETMTVANNLDEKEKPLSKSHQLLLSIGQATTPHLSSPSPKVRHTLLNLLDRIAPLLAKDENSFLPLINSIWPPLIARLFGEVGFDGDGEAAFNICAAADTIAKLCEGAGDFMASRIEDIFPQLQSLWKRIWTNVEAESKRMLGRSLKTETSKLTASVDLQLIAAHSKDLETSSASLHISTFTRTTDAQMLDALVAMLSAIISFVHITDDNGDAILSMLAPLIIRPHREAVQQTLVTWNSDACWLICERRVIEHEMKEGIRDTSHWEWRATSKPLGVDSTASASLRKVLF
jgi:hypothetical protein